MDSSLGASEADARSVLLIEDQFLIAIDIEQAMGGAGAAVVRLASSVRDALTELQVPFVFAIGYSGTSRSRRRTGTCPSCESRSVSRSWYRSSTLVGHRQFSDYVNWLTNTLEDYTSDILELIEEEHRISGKLRFHGIHRRTLFGESPTNTRFWWYGAPIFTFEGPLVRDLWALGDIHGLRSRLAPAERLSFDRAVSARP